MTSLAGPAPGRYALVATAWLGATLFGLAVASTTKIGPIVLSLSYNHGVHLGDLLAFGGGYVVALVVTVAVLSSPGTSHPRR